MESQNGHGEKVRLTVGQAIVRYLTQQFSERDGQEQRLIAGMFGIFGHGNVAGLSQALLEYGQDLPFRQAHNEQSMVHAAAAFAKATQRRSTLACTSSIGPGATNMITGAAGATINRLPVLLFPSDYYVTRHQGPVLQQLEHPSQGDVSVNDCFRPISRFFDRISRPEQLLTALPEAMRVLTNPAETGAVTIALPQDVQSHAYYYPAHFFGRRVWRIERPLPDPRRIEEAVALLRGATRPAIIAGGGAHYAQAENALAAFADRFGIPVSETFGGKGSIANESWFLLGGHGLEGTGAAAQVMQSADLIICVGTRLTDFATGSQSLFGHPNVRFISINVDDKDAHKEGALPITADAREALTAFHRAAEGAGIAPNADYRREVVQLKEQWKAQVDEAIAAQQDGVMSQGQLIRTLNEVAEAGDTVVAAAGTPPGDLLKIWNATDGRACHLEFGYSCMGYELPAGLGVRLAQQLDTGGPEFDTGRPAAGEVYVYIGDGTYILNPGEIVTAVQQGLKITVVISENHGFQSIRRLQLGSVGHPLGNEFRLHEEDHSLTPAGRREGDYVQLDLARSAEGFGACAFRVRGPDDLREALQEARRQSRTCVIVAETRTSPSLPPAGIWWDVAPAEVTGDGETQELRAAYEAKREERQRYHY
jgi:3D-(3,5/4)-trihydroxycyclohexane-1,2-dione acylhydrolase (decyclizing)